MEEALYQKPSIYEGLLAITYPKKFLVDLDPKTSNQLIEIIIKWGNVLESQNYQHLLEKKGLVEPDEVKQAKHHHLL